MSADADDGKIIDAGGLDADAKDAEETATADVADSGTATKMEGTDDEETCVKMWHELNDANDGKVTDHSELTDLWFRNLEEYANTGEVGPGQKLPFAVQFCTPGWLPTMSEAGLIKLRSFFFKVNEDGKLAMTKAEFYKQFFSVPDFGIVRGKKLLNEAGLRGVRPHHLNMALHPPT